MFSTYFQDSFEFYELAKSADDDLEASRFYRASIFTAISGVESLINFIADTCAHGNTLELHELALVNDKKFDFDKGEFILSSRTEYHRLEDKIRFFLKKFNSQFDIGCNIWSEFKEFKNFRDSIVHPKIEDNDILKEKYAEMIKSGLPATIKLMNELSKCCLSKPLRKTLLTYGDL